MLSYWLIWIILGLILIFIEIFTHKFIFLSIGVSLIIIGIIIILGIKNIFMIFIIFLFITILNVFFLRKMISKYLIKKK